MNAKALIPLVAGLGIAGVAAKLGMDFIKNAEGKQTQMVQLWTPLEDVPRGVAIDKAMLRPLEFPRSATPQSALAKLENIVGRVPHTGAPAGVPLLNSMLLPPGAQAGIRVPPGLRAVAVRVDESSGVDNHLEPGCHVDVVGVFSVKRNNRAETQARTILEDVEVAAVGARLAPTAPEKNDEKGSKKSAKREKPARAVTLLVKPDLVPLLHLAEQKGKIKLSMRGVTDASANARHENVNERDLLGFNEEQPEEQRPPTLSERLSGFMDSLWQNPEPEVEPEPVVVEQPVVEEGPERYAWVMTVYNGDERRTLGWSGLNDYQPVELSSDGPNIFEDGPKYPPANPPGVGEPSRNESSQKVPKEFEPSPDEETANGKETEFEPRELFE